MFRHQKNQQAVILATEIWETINIKNKNLKIPQTNDLQLSDADDTCGEQVAVHVWRVYSLVIWKKDFL